MENVRCKAKSVLAVERIRALRGVCVCVCVCVWVEVDSSMETVRVDL